MKKILFIFLATLGVLNLLGQTPYQINYQGIARNSLGNVLPNQNISLRLSILDGSATGSLLYQEVRELKTNYFGMFNVAIGSSGATYQIGTLSTVNWNAGGAKFLQVEMDLNGGSNFIKMGASQLQSVPYAFVAGKASPSGPAGGALSGTFPNPDLANGAVTTSKIADGSITLNKIAAGVIPSSLTPSGTAGGDLSGTYPNPTVKDGAISENKIADNAIGNSKLADNAVTTTKITDASVTAAKLAPGVIPTSLTPSGAAGGDLSGAYPNPSVASIRGTTISNTAPVTGQVLKFDGTQWTPAAESAGAAGTAGGDLTGTYPNPTVAANVIDNSKLADNAVTTTKITNASVTAAKLAPGVIPTSLTPSGTAGGDLAGSYPNPSVAQIRGTAISSTAPSSGQALIFNGAQWAPANISASASGAAGGDLTGSYPNPTVAANAIDNTKLADNAVTTTKITDASVTAAKLAPGVIPTSLTPSGTAGGDLTGTYPNPSVASIRGTTVSNAAPAAGQVLKFDGTQWTPAAESAGASGTAGGDLTGTYPNPTVAANAIDNTKLADNAVTTTKITDASVTAAKLAPGVIPSSLTPSGAAGGDLSGTYPNPTVAANAIDNTKLADNAVTTTKITDASVTAAKLAPGVIPTSLTPSGTAGGDLAGSYPTPSVAKIQGTAVSNTAPAAGQVLTYNGTQWAPANITSGSSAPSGPAGGDLSGTYPNPNIASGAITTSKIANGSIVTPKLVDGAVTTNKIADGAVTAAKLAPGLIPSSLPPSGAAGGDLAGSYPNPSVASIRGNTISNTTPTAGQVLKFDGTQWAPAAESSGASGAAGGDLTGTYPNPTVAANAINNSKLADNAVTTTKITDASVTAAKLAPGVIPTSLTPSGTAGGDLAGNYPNPSVAQIRGTAISSTAPSSGQALIFNGTQWAPANISASASGTAGGDLTGTYPNPTVAANAINNSKLADNAVTTTKITDASVTAAKLAPGVIPTSLTPSGTAGGDLGGTYPNPTVTQIQGTAVSNTAPALGQVLKYNGTTWAPAAEAAGGGSLTLPYSATQAAASSLFSITNSGAGNALEGINSSTNAGAYGIEGKITSTAPGNGSAAIKGTNSGTGSNGYGVWGSHAGSGDGVYGSSVNGYGVHASSNNIGLFATSLGNSGNAGFFDISNASNGSDALFSSTSGMGNGIVGMTSGNNVFTAGVVGLSNNSSGIGLLGMNGIDGEGVRGMTYSNVAAAVVGQNDGTYAGVYGYTNATGGTGVLAEAPGNNTTPGNALVANITGTENGNPAVFRANGLNVARIDQAGKGYFNGGAVTGGADVAEYFDVEGSRSSYEPGDVLVISQNSDRTVEKSSGAYSTLVAGVYATKPGVLLTEKNAEENHLQDMVPMGVIGVIPTKVCMEGGAIKRGDLIVTSSLPGVAMKADPDKVKIGQVIGKALQDFNGGALGIIKVLVSIK